MRKPFIPKKYRIALGLTVIVGAIFVIATSLDHPNNASIVYVGLAGFLFVVGCWLLYGGLVKSVDEIIEETDFSHIPYADGTPTTKPTEPDSPKQPKNIEEKLALRKERLEQARREGKI